MTMAKLASELYYAGKLGGDVRIAARDSVIPLTAFAAARQLEPLENAVVECESASDHQPPMPDIHESR